MKNYWERYVFLFLKKFHFKKYRFFNIKGQIDLNRNLSICCTNISKFYLYINNMQNNVILCGAFQSLDLHKAQHHKFHNK